MLTKCADPLTSAITHKYRIIAVPFIGTATGEQQWIR